MNPAILISPVEQTELAEHLKKVHMFSDEDVWYYRKELVTTHDWLHTHERI